MEVKTNKKLCFSDAKGTKLLHEPNYYKDLPVCLRKKKKPDVPSVVCITRTKKTAYRHWIELSLVDSLAFCSWRGQSLD